MSDTEIEDRPDTYPDPDRHIQTAKRLVMENYNSHQNDDMVEPLVMGDLYIATFTKTLNSWRAQVQSTVVRGLLWIVTYNSSRNETYIEVFRKINNTKVPGRERRSS